MNNQNLWGKHPLTKEQPICLDFGVVKLWCKTTLDELWLAYEHNDDSNTNFPEKEITLENDLDWKRWALKKECKEVTLHPVFPNLPVVVKPEYPFHVTKSIQTKIYVRVPLWIQVKLDEIIIEEIPTIILSKTWFGSFMEGELCYWISSGARKSIEPDLFRPFLSICPIEIYNKSDEELYVEKLCLRVGRLALYNYENQLWGSKTKTRYRGKDDISEIDVSRNAPIEVPKSMLISNSRNESKIGFTAKTFTSIKELSGFGFLNK